MTKTTKRKWTKSSKRIEVKRKIVFLLNCCWHAVVRCSLSLGRIVFARLAGKRSDMCCPPVVPTTKNNRTNQNNAYRIVDQQMDIMDVIKNISYVRCASHVKCWMRLLWTMETFLPRLRAFYEQAELTRPFGSHVLMCSCMDFFLKQFSNVHFRIFFAHFEWISHRLRRENAAARQHIFE